jgi:hypothetical protein
MPVHRQIRRHRASPRAARRASRRMLQRSKLDLLHRVLDLLTWNPVQEQDATNAHGVRAAQEGLFPIPHSTLRRATSPNRSRGNIGR